MASRRRGPLRVFRIADARHLIFDGTGAMIHGSRWNSPGRRIIYAAETYSGALLEIVVHASGGVPSSALVGYDAWITAIRSDQSSHRASARVVGRDPKFDLVKVNPLLTWTKRDVWAYIVTHGVPYNPLHDQGYASIGCWPCTRAVALGEDDRAGRWAGHAKTECGLHSLDSSQL